MKNILSFVGIIILGLVVYFLGGKFGPRPGQGTAIAEASSDDPAVEVYKQFVEFRATYQFSWAKKIATDDALKKVVKEKAWHRSMPNLEVLFISSKFKKAKHVNKNDPAQKKYVIVEERLINSQPDTPGLATRKKITYEHKFTMLRKSGAWVVADYEEEKISE